MKIQFRYRSMVLAALAISLLAIAGFPQTAWAGNSNANNGRAEVAAEKKAAANGQEKKQADGTSTGEPSEGTPTATDSPSGSTTHGSETGPGGQTCDGDPTGKSDGGSGANGGGDHYNDTCDSYDDPNNPGADNGAGGGAATGKPCEGCVGAADDKNPPGQYPDGPTDHNNGYECDEKGRSANEGNNGVGFGNPAHTGCEPQEPACVPTEANNQCQPPCDPATDANQCKPCPGGKDMEPDGTCVPKCPDGSAMPASGKASDCNPKCPDGSAMPASGKASDCNPKCPDGSAMPASGNAADCDEPCVAGTDAECSAVTPTCVASDGSDRCGGATVAGEVLGRPVERLDVLGVSIEAPVGAVAPAGLARTGGFQLAALVQAALVLALIGLGLTALGRRRLKPVDISRRLGD